MWKIVSKYPALKFTSLTEGEYDCSDDPLFDDEASIQLDQHAVKNFRFNNGYGKVHYKEFSATIKNVYVDPNFFILIKGLNKLIKESIAFDWYRISYRKYMTSVLLANVMRLDKAVIFDVMSGLNVFHFYNDVLVKIFVAKKQYPSYPLLISRILFTSKLFSFYQQFEYFKSINWIVVPERKFTFVKEAVLIKAKEYDAEKLKIIARLAVEKTNEPAKARSKIFINRRENTGRYISNFKELEPLLLKHNFLVLYMEDLSISEQVAFCANASIIAGVHGAGLTNMIFGYENRPKILEISPADFIPTHYFWLANSFGFPYKLFLGSSLNSSSNTLSFEVDVKRLDRILESEYQLNRVN